MRNLILSVALLAVAALASTAMAGGAGSSNMAFQEQWKAVQAQQKATSNNLARIQRDAARGMSTDSFTGESTDTWGTAAAAGSKTRRPR